MLINGFISILVTHLHYKKPSYIHIFKEKNLYIKNYLILNINTKIITICLLDKALIIEISLVKLKMLSLWQINVLIMKLVLFSKFL